MAAAALAISILSVLLTGGALLYAHRADQRAVDADKRAVDAEERADRGEERERASARLAALKRIRETVHDLSHSTAGALGGSIEAFAAAERQRARLTELLRLAPVPLAQCEAVAVPSDQAALPNYTRALAEVEREIALEQQRLAAI